MKKNFWLCLVVLVLALSCKNKEVRLRHHDVTRAQRLLGIHFSPAYIDTILPHLQRNLQGYDSMRLLTVENEVMPAMLFNPIPGGFKLPDGVDEVQIETPHSWLSLPESKDSLCFYPVHHLAHFIRHQKISSVELTELYLSRIKRYDRTLKAFVTLTEDLARQQAEKADADLRAGIYHGFLHGIPYGLKDLIAVQGYPTTWGATPYKTQIIDYTATVAQKLEQAGAVLLGKLSTGALARGDVWFGGQTVNPWDTLMGADGSSAGSASATAAGLVAFAIGTETLGSIIMPSSKNGVTGLRPSYGTVSRRGVMTLAWSMDKVGPIARTAQDCAIIYQVIHGLDTADVTTFQTPLVFNHQRDIGDFKIGLLTEAIAKDTTKGAGNLKTILRLLDSLSVGLIDKTFPHDLPFNAFDMIIRAESGAFFDQLIRSEGIDALEQQDQSSRAASLRQSRFIPAVEYLQANRFRNVLIDEMHQLMKDIDVLITPLSAKNESLITNLCGLPSLSLPTGLDSLGHPTSITVIAGLFKEGQLLEFGHALQKVTHAHTLTPPALRSPSIAIHK